MLRRDFLKTATATAVLTASGCDAGSAASKETPAMPNATFADVNGQHIFFSGRPSVCKHLLGSPRGRF